MASGMIVAGLAFGLALGLAACGGAVAGSDLDGGATENEGGPSAGGRGGSGGGIGFRPPDAGVGGPTRPDGGGFTDPGCPDAEPNPVDRQCDPFSAFNDCGPGFACFPFVQYPAGRCEAEQFGTVCGAAGSARQGEPCGTGQGCAGGHVCVISSEGVQCVQMCPTEGADNCPPGLICEFLDVAGIGGCI